MRIILAGGTGFLGRALAGELIAGGHEVSFLTRRAPPAAERGPVPELHWVPDGTAGPWAAALDGADAIVNLAGESIAAGRWSAGRKARMRDSRLVATGSLVEAIRSAARPPSLLVSASAIGYYGSRGDEILTEASAPGTDFLADLCVRWEAAARRAAEAGTRVVLVRTGVVLDRHEGALPRMLLPFRLVAGGPVGSGRQYVSWIHRADWVALVLWAMATPAVSGPLNATAPNPVTNEAFARAIGHALARPSWLRAPAFALRLALGEMADGLLLCSQRVVPAEAQQAGFRFRYEEVDRAVRDVLGT
jgi:hypothetical protein